MLGKSKQQDLKNLILIPDSYTSLIPFVVLHPEGDFNNTFGSTFSIQKMPSLLVMGILNEAHPTRAVMYDSRTACVVDILLLPSEVEQMNIKAALVVLSSCDSGRGMILLGYEGTELTDPVKTSIHSFYDYFRGGVFWISCRSEEVAAACVKKALEVIDEIELKTHNIAALVVLESIGPNTLTSFSSLREMAKFHKLLCHICTHIIATLHAGNNTDLSSIVGQIDTLLIRGSNIIEVEPFSPIHTTQRIVYGHLQKTKCSSPSDEERAALEILVDFTKGSPPVIDIMTSKGMCTKYPESLDAFTHRLVFTLMKVNRFQMSLTNSQ
eukprot:Em0746g1a